MRPWRATASMNLIALLPLLCMSSRCMDFMPLDTELHIGDAATIYGTFKDGVSQFLGITYATAGRWEAPMYVAPTSDINASKYGACSPQRAPQTSEFQATFNSPLGPESESGQLNLNIYVPQGIHQAPVLVYLHQGDFSSGSNSELGNDPSRYAAASGAVVVVPNYRVGPLGWACHPELTACNFGLLDAIEALRWVKRHISSFGGNPDSITLMGHSAGGIMSLYLLDILARPEYLIEGQLIHKAIIASANHMMIPLRSKETAILDFTDFMLDQGQKTIEQMRQAKLSWQGQFGRIFDPVLDGQLIQRDIATSISEGNFLRVPVLLTSTAEDGSMFVPLYFRNLPPSHYGHFLRAFLTSTEVDFALFYPCKDPTIFSAVSALLTDALFHAPMQWLYNQFSAQGVPVQMHVWNKENSAAPIYGVLEGSVHEGQVRTGTSGYGIHHYSDILLLFSPTVQGSDKFNIPAAASASIRNIYTSFIVDGASANGVTEAIEKDAFKRWSLYRILPINWVQAKFRLRPE